KRFDEMPSRAIHPRLVAGVNVVFWTSSPALSAGNQFKFYNAFGAERHRDRSIELLFGGWHENPKAWPKCSHDLVATDNLREMRRSDFFFAFRDQNQIDGELATGCANRMQRGKEG